MTAAAAALTKQLDEQLVAAEAAPPGPPPGTRVPDDRAPWGTRAVRAAHGPRGPGSGNVRPDPPAEGTVVAADPTPLEAIGAPRITAKVPEGMQVREGSVRVEVGPGVVKGEKIRYPVEPGPRPCAHLRGGRPGDGGREDTGPGGELLAEYGTVEVVVWPDWVATITGSTRVTVTVEGVPPAEPTPEPTAEPTPEPTSAAPPPGRLRDVGARGRRRRPPRRPRNPFMGIDLGTRRVGLAIAEAGETRARPLAMRGAPAHDGRRRGSPLPDRGVQPHRRAVEGLPLDMSGTEGAKAIAARNGPWRSRNRRASWSVCGTTAPVSRGEHASASPVAAAREGHRAGPVARPIVRESIARRPQSSSRMSWGPVCRTRRASGCGRWTTARNRRMDDDPWRGRAPGRQGHASSAAAMARRSSGPGTPGSTTDSGAAARGRSRRTRWPAAAAERHRRHRPVPGVPGIAAAVVLVALGTVLRPVTRSLVVGWAHGNPGALGCRSWRTSCERTSERR